MATQALYNKWRGQVFADILGQDHITKTLRNQIRAGRVGHAYLFTGMRGTGKTSTARIMAKAVNCVGETDDPPCNRCHMCRSITEGRSLDLIEIDGASNRGIDEIRQLRETVAFAPSEGRYKVYVIDEVHMLTNEAFNALLKTLEEPPPHVIFILCTTAPHRLPDTVLSRCQRFDFRRAPLPLILKKLRMICEHENIAIELDALEFVARRATGSFRDAESLLDQLASYSDGTEEITLDQVHSILGTVSSTLVNRLALSMIRADLPTGLRTINEAIDNGAEPRQFLKEIIDHLRALLLVKVGGSDDRHTLTDKGLGDLAGGQSFSLGSLIRAIKLFNEAASGLRYAVQPQLPLEMAFVEAALQSEAASGRPELAEALPTKKPLSEASRVEKVVTQPQTQKARDKAAEAPVVAVVGLASSGEGAPPDTTADGPALGQQVVGQHTSSVPPTGDTGSDAPIPSGDQGGAPVATEEAGPDDKASAQTMTLGQVRDRWNEVLAHVRPLSRRVEALLRDTQPAGVRGDLVTVACDSPFHHDVLSEDKARQIVRQALSDVLGVSCRVRYVLRSLQSGTANRPHRQNPPPTETLEAEDARRRLLNHPAIKELQRRGGHVSKISPLGQDQQEERSG